VDGRGGTCEIVDLFDFEQQRLHDVVTQELEGAAIQEMLHIGAAAGEEVVETNDLMPFVDQPLTEMRPDEPRPTRYQNPHDVPTSRPDARCSPGRIDRTGKYLG
jgi:hypothetical protein